MAINAAAAKWTEDLSPWEENRPVRKQITDDRTVTLPTKDVNSLLKCAVCLSVPEQTHAVMACLHRFCKGCITKCLDNNRKECPTCRLHVASKRNTRPDDTFDSFIRTVYPDLRQYREEEEQATQDYNQRVHMNTNYQEHTKAGQQLQAQLSRRGTKRPGDDAGGAGSGPGSGSGSGSGYALLRQSSTSSVLTTSSSYASMAPGSLKRSKSAPSRTNSSASIHSAPGGGSRGGGGGGGGSPSNNRSKLGKRSSSSGSSGSGTSSNKIDFVLRRHPEETKLPKLEKELLRTPLKCTVFHIQKYLAQKLNVDKPGGFDVFIFTKDGNEVLLHEKNDLRYVKQTLREAGGQMNGAKSKKDRKGKRDEVILYFRSSSR